MTLFEGIVITALDEMTPDRQRHFYSLLDQAAAEVAEHVDDNTLVAFFSDCRSSEFPLTFALRRAACKRKGVNPKVFLMSEDKS